MVASRIDDGVPRRFQASQPAGCEIVAQCVSTVRQHWESDGPPQPRNGAEEPVRRSFFRPVPGLAHAARLLPTALRRGLLSCALRALLRLAATRGRLAATASVPPPSCLAFDESLAPRRPAPQYWFEWHSLTPPRSPSPSPECRPCAAFRSHSVRARCTRCWGRTGRGSRS